MFSLRCLWNSVLHCFSEWLWSVSRQQYVRPHAEFCVKQQRNGSTNQLQAVRRVKGDRTENTSCPQNVENLQCFHLRAWIWLFHQNQKWKCFFFGGGGVCACVRACVCVCVFCFKFELVKGQPCWFALYQWRAEKVWLVTYLILPPHMPAMFMTSPIHNAVYNRNGSTRGHVLATLNQTLMFNKQGEKSSQILGVYMFVFVYLFVFPSPFLLIEPVVLLRLWFPLSWQRWQ